MYVCLLLKFKYQTSPVLLEIDCPICNKVSTLCLDQYLKKGEVKQYIGARDAAVDNGMGAEESGAAAAHKAPR